MRTPIPPRIFLAATTIVLIAISTAHGEETEDKTLAPYFAIEGGDPSVDQLPLKRTSVDIVVTGVIARVRVKQTYANEGERPINAQYTFPASTRASVHAMKMTIGEQVINAVVRERETAKQEFAQAKIAGKVASLLQQHRPNVFSMDVANVMPGDQIDIELSYTELLVPKDGTYDVVFPTVVGPRYSKLTGGDENQWIQSPYLQEGERAPARFDIAVKLLTGLPVQELSCTSHQIDTDWKAENEVAVSLDSEKRYEGNRDFILKFRLAGQQIETGLLLYEDQDEQFFLLMAQPPERVSPEDIPSREYIFVVDVSGSMNGFPLNVSKELLRSLIGNLRPSDRFNVVLFASASEVMAPQSLPATAANIDQAVATIDRQRGGGGTELASALQRAFALPREEDHSRSVILVTDGYIAAEKEVFSLIRENLADANVFAFGIGSSVNRFLIEGVAHAGKGEPFIVTDPGEAPGKAAKFREYVESPVLTNVAVSYDGFDAYDVEPAQIPDLFAQRPILVFGKWRGSAEGTIQIDGVGGDGNFSRQIAVSESKATAEYQPLRWLWARAKIADLSDYGHYSDGDETKREIVSLGITYNLLTRYTSFIAVHDEIRNRLDSAQDVVQPLPLPQGVSNLAVATPPAKSAHTSRVRFGRSGAQVPEPGLLPLLALLLGGTAVFALRKRLRTQRN